MIERGKEMGTGKIIPFQELKENWEYKVIGLIKYKEELNLLLIIDVFNSENLRIIEAPEWINSQPRLFREDTVFTVRDKKVFIKA